MEEPPSVTLLIDFVRFLVNWRKKLLEFLLSYRDMDSKDCKKNLQTIIQFHMEKFPYKHWNRIRPLAPLDISSSSMIMLVLIDLSRVESVVA